MPPATDDRPGSAPSIDLVLRRELYFFTLYRAFEAALLAFVTFSPFAPQVVDPHYSNAMQALATGYMGLALALLLAMRSPQLSIGALAAIGLAIDIGAALFAKHLLLDGDAIVAMMLLVNLGAGAVLLPMRTTAALALASSIGSLGQFAIAAINPSSPLGQSDGVETVMFAVTYLAAAALCHLLGRQLRHSTALADRRGAELANLSHLNELIIRRMRTGVLVVDADNRIRLMNEAAWHLLGGPRPDQRELREVSPELSRRLARWRSDRVQDAEPVSLAPDRPPVVPRVATLTVIDELFMIFLDDGRLVSRRAEELTLATLGRLSAGIAHEVRNPLAAIKHAAQLLEESPDLPDGDRRLVEIVLNHCNRMNGIVENVLQLARRERSQPEHIDICDWSQQFVDEFSRVHPVERHELHAATADFPIVAMVDPQQLHQVATALVQNAISYGHRPAEPARITLRAGASDSGHPYLEISDHGPGIPADLVAQVFDPFFTTNELGTGLGLYIARQLCEANQALLEYAPASGGGSCFRINLARPIPLTGQQPAIGALRHATG